MRFAAQCYATPRRALAGDSEKWISDGKSFSKLDGAAYPKDASAWTRGFDTCAQAAGTGITQVIYFYNSPSAAAYANRAPALGSRKGWYSPHRAACSSQHSAQQPVNCASICSLSRRVPYEMSKSPQPLISLPHSAENDTSETLRISTSSCTHTIYPIPSRILAQNQGFALASLRPQTLMDHQPAATYHMHRGQTEGQEVHGPPPIGRKLAEQFMVVPKRLSQAVPRVRPVPGITPR